MGDCTITPLGDFAVNIFEDTDTVIKFYLSSLADVISQCSANKVQGLSRVSTIKYFNYSYLYKKGDIRIPKTKTATMFHFRHDADMLDVVSYRYLDKALNLCLTTDIVSKTGLTLKDVMQMDLNTFDFIKRKYDEYKSKEQAIANAAIGDLGKSLSNNSIK